MATLGGLDELGVLFLEKFVVFLGFPSPDAVGSEDQVHLFQSALVGLGVESPDHGNGDHVGSTEDVVGLFTEGLEDVWQHHGEPAITDGPADNAPGVTLGTDLQGEDLSRVQPWDSEPGGAEGGGKQEDHSDGTIGETLSLVRALGSSDTGGRKTTSSEHGNALDDGAPVEGPAATNSVESEDADQGSEHVDNVVETGDPLDGGVGDTSSTEDGGSEDGDTGDTDPFLHNLKPDNELDTTTGVELARPDTEEHVDVGLACGRLSLKLSDVADVLELSLGLA